jgi:diadenosine tetraphosphate (Ap4A) HIT family hydrolase
MKAVGCALCDGPGGAVIASGPKFRVVRADEAGFPAFYRLVWQDHVAEFSQLTAADRHLCIDAVVQVEEALHAHLSPTKVNLASLGNAVPHLHWHVVARFAWDERFPGSVWSPPQRAIDTAAIAGVEQQRPALEADIAKRLA